MSYKVVRIFEGPSINLQRERAMIAFGCNVVGFCIKKWCSDLKETTSIQRGRTSTEIRIKNSISHQYREQQDGRVCRQANAVYVDLKTYLCSENQYIDLRVESKEVENYTFDMP